MKHILWFLGLLIQAINSLHGLYAGLTFCRQDDITHSLKISKMPSFAFPGKSDMYWLVPRNPPKPP